MHPSDFTEEVTTFSSGFGGNRKRKSTDIGCFEEDEQNQVEEFGKRRCSNDSAVFFAPLDEMMDLNAGGGDILSSPEIGGYHFFGDQNSSAAVSPFAINSPQAVDSLSPALGYANGGGQHGSYSNLMINGVQVQNGEFDSLLNSNNTAAPIIDNQQQQQPTQLPEAANHHSSECCTGMSVEPYGGYHYASDNNAQEYALLKKPAYYKMQNDFMMGGGCIY